jgi:hypothetical protein
MSDPQQDGGDHDPAVHTDHGIKDGRIEELSAGLGQLHPEDAGEQATNQ